MQLGFLAFLGAFAGFYLGLAAYLILRNLIRFPQVRSPRSSGEGSDSKLAFPDTDESNAHL